MSTRGRARRCRRCSVGRGALIDAARRLPYVHTMSFAEQDRSLVLRGLRYLGGHPAAPQGLDRVDMFFDDAGVSFERGREQLGVITWDDIHGLTADAESTSTRMTLPRVWFFGILATLFQKRERHVLLRVADRRGAWLFAVEGISLADLRSGIDQLRRRYLP